MRVEAHEENLRESFESIREAVEKGLVGHQRNIGFHTSSAMCDMLELLLHKLSLIDPGSSIKHEFFTSERIADQHFPFAFPMKKEILELVIRIESKRNILCYGKRQKEEFIREAVEDFNTLRSKLKEAGYDGL